MDRIYFDGFDEMEFEQLRFDMNMNMNMKPWGGLEAENWLDWFDLTL